jgi:hypothetical protein
MKQYLMGRCKLAKQQAGYVLWTTLWLLVQTVASQALGAEKESSGWSLYIDNDLFVPGGRDLDYTGGVALKLSGAGVGDYFLAPDSGLGELDHFSGFDRLVGERKAFTTHSIEYGFTLFTPSDLKQQQRLPKQHPYASLFFVSSTRMTIVPQELLTYQSSLTFGLLGLALGGELQKGIHRVVGGNIPQGWQHQISAGGEPTLRYSLARSKSYLLHQQHDAAMEVRLGSEVNIGFSTDAGVEASMRWGAIHSPWWSFNPHNAEYISLGAPSAARKPADGALESYVWAGISLKYRFYNALLQGQFRDSDVTFSRSELVPWIAEIWFGYTLDLDAHWQLSAFMRARNHEIDLPTERNPAWGGFIISKTF